MKEGKGRGLPRVAYVSPASILSSFGVCAPMTRTAILPQLDADTNRWIGTQSHYALRSIITFAKAVMFLSRYVG